MGFGRVSQHDLDRIAGVENDRTGSLVRAVAAIRAYAHTHGCGSVGTGVDLKGFTRLNGSVGTVSSVAQGRCGITDRCRASRVGLYGEGQTVTATLVLVNETGNETIGNGQWRVVPRRSWLADHLVGIVEGQHVVADADEGIVLSIQCPARAVATQAQNGSIRDRICPHDIPWGIDGHGTSSCDLAQREVA